MYLQSKIELLGLPRIDFSGTLHRVGFSESRFSHRYAPIDWPSIHVSGDIERPSEGHLIQSPLVSLDHPLFPDGLEALKTVLNLRVSDNLYRISPQIEIIIPDYGAKIAGLVIDGTHTTLEAVIGAGHKEEIIVKYYSRGLHRTQNSGNLPLRGNHIVFELDEEPLIIEVHLLSSKDGSTIDRISYNYRHARTRQGVTLKDEQVLLLDLISRGENQNVEFKQDLNKKKRSEFMESVVAFANTAGGRILLGVSDNGGICGLLETNIRGKIDLWVTEFCDPPIEVEYRVASLQEQSIGIIDVPEGENKIYVLKGRGPYVRRGSTDRSAKRSELDEFYQEKKSGVSF